jgi:hypothetical protein
MTNSIASHGKPSGFDVWFAALTKNAHSAVPDDASQVPIASQEGALMQRLLLAKAHANELEAPVSENPASDYWEKLLLRARDQGLFSHHESIPRADATQHICPLMSKRIWPRAANERWYAVVASMALLTVGIGLWNTLPNATDSNDATVVMRGDESPQRIIVPTIEMGRTVHSVVTIFERHQIIYLINHTATGVQLQAKIAPNSEAAVRLLEVGIQTPPHGRVNVFFTTTDQ